MFLILFGQGVSDVIVTQFVVGLVRVCGCGFSLWVWVWFVGVGAFTVSPFRDTQRRENQTHCLLNTSKLCLFCSIGGFYGGRISQYVFLLA